MRCLVTLRRYSSVRTALGMRRRSNTKVSCEMRLRSSRAITQDVSITPTVFAKAPFAHSRGVNNQSPQRQRAEGNQGFLGLLSYLRLRKEFNNRLLCCGGIERVDHDEIAGEVRLEP